MDLLGLFRLCVGDRHGPCRIGYARPEHDLAWRLGVLDNVLRDGSRGVHGRLSPPPGVAPVAGRFVDAIVKGDHQEVVAPTFPDHALAWQENTACECRDS